MMMNDLAQLISLLLDDYQMTKEKLKELEPKYSAELKKNKENFLINENLRETLNLPKVHQKIPMLESESFSSVSQGATNPITRLVDKFIQSKKKLEKIEELLNQLQHQTKLLLLENETLYNSIAQIPQFKNIIVSTQKQGPSSVQLEAAQKMIQNKNETKYTPDPKIRSFVEHKINSMDQDFYSQKIEPTSYKLNPEDLKYIKEQSQKKQWPPTEQTSSKPEEPTKPSFYEKQPPSSPAPILVSKPGITELSVQSARRLPSETQFNGPVPRPVVPKTSFPPAEQIKPTPQPLSVKQPSEQMALAPQPLSVKQPSEQMAKPAIIKQMPQPATEPVSLKQPLQPVQQSISASPTLELAKDKVDRYLKEMRDLEEDFKKFPNYYPLGLWTRKSQLEDLKKNDYKQVREMAPNKLEEEFRIINDLIELFRRDLQKLYQIKTAETRIEQMRKSGKLNQASLSELDRISRMLQRLEANPNSVVDFSGELKAIIAPLQKIETEMQKQAGGQYSDLEDPYLLKYLKYQIKYNQKTGEDIKLLKKMLFRK